jgi:hypothetical protein
MEADLGELILLITVVSILSASLRVIYRHPIQWRDQTASVPEGSRIRRLQPGR